MIKLNIGSFTCMSGHDWLNVDIIPLYQHAIENERRFLCHDARYGFQFWPNSQIDLIFTSHFLEHITYNEGRAFLFECHRLLKPGGTIRIGVPDLTTLIADYVTKQLAKHDSHNEPCARAASQAEKLWCVLMENHKAIYDYPALSHALTLAGFSKVTRCSYKQGHPTIIAECEDLYPELTLYVEAEK